MMDKRKLDGAVDKSSAQSDAIVHNLWKIWRPVPSGTRSYGRLAGSLADEIWARLEIFNACCRLKYSIFRFV